jgi:hypothetical protein
MDRPRLNPKAALRCFVGLVAMATSAQAADDPEGWLQRMERALTTRNYEGVFVHEHGGQSETLRILHRVSNGEIAERIVSMDGSGREFIRRGAELSTYLPDQKMVLVERSPDSGLLLTELRAVDTTASGQYASRSSGARVAGRDTRVIAVEPLDDFRYGYRIGSTKPRRCRSSRAALGQRPGRSSSSSQPDPAGADGRRGAAAGHRRARYRWLRYDSAAAATDAAAHGRRASCRRFHDGALDAAAPGQQRGGHAPGVQRRACLGIGVRGVERARLARRAGDRHHQPRLLLGVLDDGGRPPRHGDRRSAAGHRARDRAFPAPGRGRPGSGQRSRRPHPCRRRRFRSADSWQRTAWWSALTWPRRCRG